MKKGLKLNLGCGKNYMEGYINCDISEEVRVDKVFDMGKVPWPFKDGSVIEVLMNNVLEHFHEPLKILKEIHRICKNGAKIKILVPYFSHECAFSMLDHYHQFTWTSFDALEKKHWGHWQSVGDFRIIKKKLLWRKQFFFLSFFNLFPRVYQEFFCWIFPAQGLHIELEVVK